MMLGLSRQETDADIIKDAEDAIANNPLLKCLTNYQWRDRIGLTPVGDTINISYRYVPSDRNTTSQSISFEEFFLNQPKDAESALEKRLILTQAEALREWGAGLGWDLSTKISYNRALEHCLARYQFVGRTTEA